MNRLSGSGQPVYRPLFLLYLLPLVVGAAILVTYGTGFVPVSSGTGFGPFGPSYGFPLAWRYSICETLPCTIGVAWSVFWLDVLFYVGLQYALIVFYAVHLGKLPRPPSLPQLLGRDRLALAFQLSLAGGAFMMFVPALIVPSSPSTGVACLVPSPCQTQQDYYRWALGAAIYLWAFPGFVTLFVDEMLGLVGKLGPRLIASVLVGLAGVQLSGLQVFLFSGVIGFLKLSVAEASTIAATISIGPALLFASALLLVKDRTI